MHPKPNSALNWAISSTALSFQHIWCGVTLQSVIETGSSVQTLTWFRVSPLSSEQIIKRLRCLNSQTQQQETASALLTLSACVCLHVCVISPLFGHCLFFPSTRKKWLITLKVFAHVGEHRGRVLPALYPTPSCCCPSSYNSKTFCSGSKFKLNRSACVNQSGLSEGKRKKMSLKTQQSFSNSKFLKWTISTCCTRWLSSLL